MDIKGKRVLSNGAVAGYVKQNDGTWKWRFISGPKSKGNAKNEKMMKGGFSYQTPRGRATKLRGIKNIQASHRLNTKLWEAAEDLLLV